jgi:hypothetical protein
MQTQLDSIRTSVDPTTLLANAKGFFSARAWLAELCQNSLRSNATTIDVHIDVENKKITFEDNGDGIRNLNDLVTIAISNWDEAVKRQQKPAGMGAFSFLLACPCRITSGNQTVDTTPEAIIGFHDMPVTKLPKTLNGTWIELLNADTYHNWPTISRAEKKPDTSSDETAWQLLQAHRLNMQRFKELALCYRNAAGQAVSLKLKVGDVIVHEGPLQDGPWANPGWQPFYGEPAQNPLQVPIFDEGVPSHKAIQVHAPRARYQTGVGIVETCYRVQEYPSSHLTGHNEEGSIQINYNGYSYLYYNESAFDHGTNAYQLLSRVKDHCGILFISIWNADVIDMKMPDRGHALLNTRFEEFIKTYARPVVDEWDALLKANRDWSDHDYSQDTTQTWPLLVPSELVRVEIEVDHNDSATAGLEHAGLRLAFKKIQEATPNIGTVMDRLTSEPEFYRSAEMIIQNEVDVSEPCGDLPDGIVTERKQTEPHGKDLQDLYENVQLNDTSTHKPKLVAPSTISGSSLSIARVCNALTAEGTLRVLVTNLAVADQHTIASGVGLSNRLHTHPALAPKLRGVEDLCLHVKGLARVIQLPSQLNNCVLYLFKEVGLRDLVTGKVWLTKTPVITRIDPGDSDAYDLSLVINQAWWDDLTQKADSFYEVLDEGFSFSSDQDWDLEHDNWESNLPSREELQAYFDEPQDDLTDKFVEIAVRHMLTSTKGQVEFHAYNDHKMHLTHAEVKNGALSLRASYQDNKVSVKGEYKNKRWTTQITKRAKAKKTKKPSDRK